MFNLIFRIHLHRLQTTHLYEVLQRLSPPQKYDFLPGSHLDFESVVTAQNDKFKGSFYGPSSSSFIPSSKSTFSQPFKERSISNIVRICKYNHVSPDQAMKNQFLNTVYLIILFLVRLWGKFEIDHSWEWKSLRQVSILTDMLVQCIRHKVNRAYTWDQSFSCHPSSYCTWAWQWMLTNGSAVKYVFLWRVSGMFHTVDMPLICASH